MVGLQGLDKVFVKLAIRSQFTIRAYQLKFSVSSDHHGVS